MSTLQTYALRGPALLDPRWFNGVRHGQHAVTVNPDGTLTVDGETLRFGEQAVPPGTTVKVWLNSTGFFVCATDLALHEQALAQEAAAQAEKAARGRALDALRADAEAFNARLKLPVRWDVGIKEVLSGLSESSMGHGRNKATVEHIYLLEPLKDGRLVRQAGDLLCTNASGSNGKRWSDKIVERLHDSCGAPFVPKVSCKSCLSLASRWVVEPESTITPPDQSMTTTQSTANELDEEITHALTELDEDVSVERIGAIRSRISENLLIGEDRAAAVMIAVRMARTSLDSDTHQAIFRSDIPSESWLETKVRYAIEDGRNQWGVPRTMGPITGSFSRDLLLPLDLLAKIPGERGEQNDVRPASLAWLRNNLAKEIRSSVYIEIDPFGKAWVNEGNHRIMMAVEKKLSALPVHVRYFSGGERVADLSPARLLELDAQFHFVEQRPPALREDGPAIAPHGPTYLPVVRIERVTHIGEMNPAARDSTGQSLEGHALSVSTTPHAWEEIATIGGRPWFELTNHDANFVDVLALLADETRTAALRSWAQSEGLLRPEQQYRAWYLDTDSDEWHYFVADSRETAWSEIDTGEFDSPDDAPGPDGKPCIEPICQWVGTPALESAVGRVGLNQTESTDMALMIFVERHCPDIDGLWWTERYDPLALSAPRGGILPDRLARWTATPVYRHRVDDEIALPEASEMPVHQPALKPVHEAQPVDATAKDAPLRCTLDEFLCGADGADAYIEQHFDDYVRDIDTSFNADDVEIVEYTADDEDGPYGIVASSDSVLLVHRAKDASTWSGAEVVGYYNTPGAVCIQDEHQGHGLGAELILWTALHWSGGPPTDGLDEQCFSEAGYAAHVAAWNLGVKRGLIIDREPELAEGLDCAP
jgi:GNAT superfamily N-acetyltransferase